MDENNNNHELEDSHGSGFISTIIFLASTIVVMILVRHFLNY